MVTDNTKSEKSQVINTSEDKGDQQCLRKRIVIFVIATVIVMLIIVAVSLGVVLTKDDSSGDNEESVYDGYPVILISADGFRHEYLTRGVTPNITKFGNSGVQAKFMLSQFPTKTFPNHYTAVTGLYPESHGIVFNAFYDPDLKRRFSIKRSLYRYFWHGEPIWITAKKNGLKSASYFWVGSEVQGIRPTYYRKYNHSVPFSDRVEQVLQWLQLPEKSRPSFITLYFDQPDTAGHKSGPDSLEVEQQIEIIDKTIGQLLIGLEDLNISESVNVILMSDHGMSSVNCNETIFLDKYGVLANELYISNYGSVLSFNNKKKNDREKVLNMIKCVNDSFQAFYKADLPKRMHFSKSKRIDDILALADPRQLLSVNSTSTFKCKERGTHGYDNIFPDMRQIFMARGPSFQKGKVVEHFSNLEIYNLLATLLKIKPAPNNGTMGSLNSLLVPEARVNVSESHGDGTVFRKDICNFPNDKVFYYRSRNGVCDSCNASEKEISKTNMIFNISAEEAISYEEEHLPRGLPEGGAGLEGCILIQPYFVTGYSTYLRIPLWTANRINGTQLLPHGNKSEDCYRSDVRLAENQSAHCASFNNSGYEKGRLVSSRDLNFNKMAMLSTSTFSNVVPMYPVFKEGVWAKLESMIRDWAIKYNVIHVITGTIFDVDRDGIKDKEISIKRRTYNLPDNPAIPTHMYKIVTRCDTKMKSEYEIEKCSGSIRVISFILQHTNDSCKFHSYEKLILQNVAPVKDIELLTGINFFPKLPAQLQVEMKTSIPVELWS